MARLHSKTGQSRNAIINVIVADLGKAATREDVIAAVDLALYEERSNQEETVRASANSEAGTASTPTPSPSARTVAMADPDFDPYPQGEFTEEGSEYGYAATSSTTVEVHPAIAYLQDIFEPGDWIDLFYIHKGEKYTAKNGKQYPCTRDGFMFLEDAAREREMADVTANQANGWNSYIGMNAYTPGRNSRSRQDITAIRTVYVEHDEDDPGHDMVRGEEGLKLIAKAVESGEIPLPHYVIRSSMNPVAKYQTIWRVKDFSVAEQEALIRALRNLVKSDPASCDAARVLRLPGTLNLKYDPPGKVDVIEHNPGPRYAPADFKIERKVINRQKYRQGAPESDEVLARKIGYIETALKASGIQADFHEYGDRGYMWTLACPWAHEHTTPGDSAEIFLYKDGGYGFHCFHRCRVKTWKEHFRPWLQQKAEENGHKFPLVFGTFDDIPADQRKNEIVLVGGVPPGAPAQNEAKSKPLERLDYVLVFEEAEDLELVKPLGFNLCSASESAELLMEKYNRVLLMGSSKSKALSGLHARIPGSIFVDFPPDYTAQFSLGYGGKRRYPPANKLSEASYADGEELLREDDIRGYLNGVISMGAVRASSVLSQRNVTAVEPTETVEKVDVMPSSAMASSRLGDIYAEKFEPYGWPLDLALPALVTAASAIVPQLPPPDQSKGLVIAGDDPIATLYTALIAPPHCGKSQVIEWAAKAIGIYSESRGPHYYEVKTGSAEQLIKSLDKHKAIFRNSVLITPDEWAHLFAKAAIPDASFPTFLTTSFYRRQQTITMAKGKEFILNLAMSFIGGIVEDDFDTVFNASSLGGLYDRFLFGRAPEGFMFNYRPYAFPVVPTELLGWKPVPVRHDDSVFEVIGAWNKRDSSWGRIVEICTRVATIYASMDGRDVVTGKDLEALEGLAQYQASLRAQFRPNAGMNPDAIFANAAMNWINKNAPEWTHISKLKNGVHAYEMKLGPNVAERALLSLARGGRIELWLRDSKYGLQLPADYRGPMPRTGLVRRVKS